MPAAGSGRVAPPASPSRGRQLYSNGGSLSRVTALATARELSLGLTQRARPDARVHRLVLLWAMVAAQVAAVGWFTTRSYFFFDDYIFLRQGQRAGLSLDLLLQPLNPHFSPGHRLVNWMLDTFFPLNFGVAQGVLLACFAGSVVVLYKVLSELFGTGPGPLLLSLLYGTSIIHVGVIQWWNGGLLTLPATLLSLLSILTFIRYHKTGSSRLLVLSVAAMSLALLFYVKAVLVPLYLVLLRLLVLDWRPLKASLAALWRERTTWALYAAPVVLYLIVFLRGYWQPSKLPSPAYLLQYLQISWARVFAPSFVGFRIPSGEASAGAQVAIVAVQLLVVALVVWSLVRSPRAWRAWAFFAVAFAANVSIIGLPRLRDWGAGIAYTPRYHLEATFLFPIALGAAFLRAHSQPGGVSSPGRRPLRWRLAMGGGLVVLLAIHLGAAWSGAGRINQESPGPEAGRYMRNVEEGLRRAEAEGATPAIVDGTVPDYVVASWSVYGPPYHNRYSEVFPLFGRPLSFDRPEPPLFSVADDGTLGPISFTPAAGGAAAALWEAGTLTVAHGQVEQVAGELCVQSSGLPVAVELTPRVTLYGREWHLALHYSAAAELPLRLFVDNGQGYPAGSNHVLASAGRGEAGALKPLGGPTVERLRLDVPSGARVCFDRLDIGHLVPAG